MGGLIAVIGLIFMAAPFGMSSHDLSTISGYASTGEGVTLDALNIKTNLTIVGAAVFVGGMVMMGCDSIVAAVRRAAHAGDKSAAE